MMTLQQQAYELIDKLPSDRVEVVIQVMIKMMPDEEQPTKPVLHTMDDEVSPKMRAYLKMQELRKETAKYDISTAQRDAALDQKFGTFG